MASLPSTVRQLIDRTSDKSACFRLSRALELPLPRVLASARSGAVARGHCLAEEVIRRAQLINRSRASHAAVLAFETSPRGIRRINPRGLSVT